MTLPRTLLAAGAASALAAASLLFPSAALANDQEDRGNGDEPVAELLTDDLLAGTSGSTIGPDRALYVTEGTGGRVVRINPQSGATSTFAEGLPIPAGEHGGPVDVVFSGRTAYVLVTFTDPELGGDAPNGVYRIDDTDEHTLIADLSAYNRSNLPDEFDWESGNPFAIEAVRGGFLVTESNHNRLLHVSKDGDIEELAAFDNVVPTGLEVDRKRIYVAEAGPSPHDPEDGRVVSVDVRDGFELEEVASGAPLLVDVEFGKCGRLYALSNGEAVDNPAVTQPAQPNTGALLRVTRNGDLDVVVAGLNRPSSVEFLGRTALITTIEGEVWRVDGVGSGCRRQQDDGGHGWRGHDGRDGGHWRD